MSYAREFNEMFCSKVHTDSQIFEDEEGGRWSTSYGAIVYCSPNDYIFSGWLPVYPTQEQKNIAHRIGVEKIPKTYKKQYVP